jgi:hypothetical protein
MEIQLLYIVALLAAGTLVGSFWKMKGGFGPFNLRVIGIVLVTSFSALLAVVKPESLNACLGILGAVAGYLFGSASKDKEAGTGDNSSVAVDSSDVGAGAKIAGRDINETIQNLRAEVANIDKLVQKMNSNVHQSVESGSDDYLINTIYGRGDRMFNEISEGIQHWEGQGWQFKQLSSDYQGMDGVFLVFRRTPQGPMPIVECYHGSQHKRVA